MDPSPSAARRLQAACACVTLLPFLLLHGQFQRLFWFGDEWDLLLDLREAGFWPWVATAYGENFAPLFKLLWGGALLASGGSYFLLLALEWLTHALNVFLLGAVLSRAGLSKTSCALSMLVFGLSTTSLEALGWSMEWDLVLSATFLLAGALLVQALAERFTTTRLLLLALVVLASGLSFVRGVLTGPALAVLCLPPSFGLIQAPGRRRAALLAAAVLPSVLVALCVVAFGVPSTDHGFLPDDRASWLLAAEFAATAPTPGCARASPPARAPGRTSHPCAQPARPSWSSGFT